MDVDTIIPAMMIDSGGSALQIGILSAIMVGGANFSQVFYAPFISNFKFKRKFLLIGINSRIVALLGMALLLFYSGELENKTVIWLIFLLISFFSFGGAYANVSYTDILGKSVLKDSRKSFFSIRQVLNGAILFLSALAAKQVLSASQYPENYAFAFLIACGALLLASAGFWNIKEVVPSKLPVKNASAFIHWMKNELSGNLRLKYFLGFVNTMGVSISVLPFMILYAKNIAGEAEVNAGLFLVFKIIGSVATGLILFLLAKKYQYRYLLYGSSLLAFILPLFILMSPESPAFPVIFIIGGVIFTIYNITMNGILLELSGTENRTLYAGITGTGNIFPALFPVVGGWIIQQFGFTPFFLLYMLIIAASGYFIYKINCLK
ncbi:MAG TPA: MFS transporter [Balneolaceae bacterium]|nr:MFS transporter [Balneolaceae bacterium]|tara:strand:+ start:4059 stop:5195 length:1137 start_codon:yes stop_codon:yes gene_type:complete